MIIASEAKQPDLLARMSAATSGFTDAAREAPDIAAFIRATTPPDMSASRHNRALDFVGWAKARRRRLVMFCCIARRAHHCFRARLATVGTRSPCGRPLCPPYVLMSEAITRGGKAVAVSGGS